MTKYVALLRGINVGGNAKVEMLRLKALFEKLGCQNVTTYINSGNVIFDDSRSAKALTSLIEKELIKEFGLKLRIVLRDRTNIAKLIKEIPASWTNDKTQRTYVFFLWNEVDEPKVLHGFSWDPVVETLRYQDGAIVWNIPMKNYKAGSSPKLIKANFYKYVTSRNINTVRKIYELMQA